MYLIEMNAIAIEQTHTLATLMLVQGGDACYLPDIFFILSKEFENKSKIAAKNKRR